MIKSVAALAGMLAALSACDAGEATDRPGGGGQGGDAGSAGTAGGAAGDAGGKAGSGGAPTDGGGGSAGADALPTGDAGPVAPGGYYTRGNKIFRYDGTAHLFHGVSRPSLEWNQDGEFLSQADYGLMKAWGANIVRVPLNQTFWLNTASYKTTVDQQVKWIEGHGMDVILDLHWSDKGGSAAPAQQRMADSNSRTFWQQVAEKYKTDGRVQFELYNEPHDVAAEVWKNGGASGDGFTVVGMQALYDTVRATGAHNLVIVGGRNYAYDLAHISSHRITGYNIAYATHPYDHGDKGQSDWQRAWGFLTATDPVIVTEFGAVVNCGDQYNRDVIAFANRTNTSWLGWAWYPKDCKFPSLVSDWSGTPTTEGRVVRDALLAY